MSRPMIIDTFPINNELAMLACRLETMSPAVDYFVAVEADVDHQDHPKPYHITENLHLFEEWADKLIVVRATGLPTFTDDPDPWARELAQREYAKYGLRQIDGITADTIIFHGDVDELVRPLHARNVRPGNKLFSFEQTFHCFAVDWLHPDPWFGTVAGTVAGYASFGANPFHKVRNTRNRNESISGAGWHFSWMGGQKAALAKLRAFCHPEIAERTLTGLTSDMYLREGFHVDGRRMKPVDVDDTWPAYIAERRCPDTWFRPR